MPASTRWRHSLVIAVLAALALAIFLRPPIAQDPAYHGFADNRPGLGIPNTLDVLSNAAFAGAGAWGLLLLRARPAWTFDWWARLAFSVSLLFTAAGSAWYHLAPDNTRLLWDRLPMTTGFMSISALLLSVRISHRTGRLLFLPLLILGPASALYWSHTESLCRGDLRPYIFVQALPVVLILLLIPLFPTRGSRNALWLSAVACYALAKLAESFDGAIFHRTGFVGGHALKHILAALACCLLLRALDPVRHGDLASS